MSKVLAERTRLINLGLRKIGLSKISHVQSPQQRRSSLSKRTCKKEEKSRCLRRKFNRRSSSKVFPKQIKALGEKRGKFKPLSSVQNAASKLPNICARALPPATKEILKQINTQKLNLKNSLPKSRLKRKRRYDFHFSQNNSERIEIDYSKDIFSHCSIYEAPDISLVKVNRFLRNLDTIEIKLEKFYTKYFYI